MKAIPSRPTLLPWRPLLALLALALTPWIAAHADDRLVGRWSMDEGFQTVELTFRSDGRYERQVRGSDPVSDEAMADRGFYTTTATTLSLESYEYFGERGVRAYGLVTDGNTLELTREEFSLVDTFQRVPGSREAVLAEEKVARDPVGSWSRQIPFAGTETYTFRPGGYYFVERTTEGTQLPPEILRGRYVLEDSGRLVLRPYSSSETVREMDFFGDRMFLIRREEFSGDAYAFRLHDGSRAFVAAKAAEAEAFLAQEHWFVGVWEIRDPFLQVDFMVRPDGRYAATNMTEFLQGVVRGRYQRDQGHLRLSPFVGQGLYARSNGDFGKEENERELDYYDGELQFIDLGSLSQRVFVARKRSGSQADVLERARTAQAERSPAAWLVGEWEVHDPSGWMQFTLRPDGRYIAQAGSGDVPSQVERGRYVQGTDRLSLVPYEGQGPARGFETDYFDGELVLAGDLSRLVVARKVAGSEATVVARTLDPSALKGELGNLLGLWTSHLPGLAQDLVLRDDGEFRLTRCTGLGETRDYGLYTLDLEARRLVIDSRFSPVRTLGLDFYGDTLTLHGPGWGSPTTYKVNLGQAAAAQAASRAADEVREGIDASWLQRVPLAARRGGTEPFPTAGLPADPLPAHVLEGATVLGEYQLYRRLIPGFVYFNVLGEIKSVAVVNTREWHFLPNGRVLVRFRNHFAGPFYPSTFEDVSDSWGAYRVGGQPTERDVLHRYADNGVFLEMDAGDAVEMTLEDGRRHLFWEKDYQILQTWASEQKPVPCTLPADADARLGNSGVSLATTIPAELPPEASGLRIELRRGASGVWLVKGSNPVRGALVLESAASVGGAATWQAVATREVEAGPFEWPLPAAQADAGFFRVRRP